MKCKGITAKGTQCPFKAKVLGHCLLHYNKDCGVKVPKAVGALQTAGTSGLEVSINARSTGLKRVLLKLMEAGILSVNAGSKEKNEVKRWEIY